jgi:hypothetical protein
MSHTSNPNPIIGALEGVHGGTSEALQGFVQSHPDGDAPSILIESAEGIATFPGLNGDAESRVAREFIGRRFAEIADPGNSKESD